jgi:peptide/nickel transport system substrate-binding protein
MSPGAKRSAAFGAGLMLAATALAAVPAAAQDEDVPQGGTIVVGEWQQATQLNTFMSNALRDQEAAWIISRPLVTIDNDGRYIPEFLTEVPTVENGLVVLDEDGDGFTVKLNMKEGLKWSDGTPFTLHDFKALYDWALGVNIDGSAGCVYCLSFVPIIDPSLEGEARYAPENQYVESITVSDDGLSGEIRFRKNYSAFINGLLFQPLIAPHYWAEVPVDEIATRAVPGSDTLLEIPTNGPFVVSAASADGIDFVPSPHWTADSGPNLDELRLRFFGDKDGMFAAFLNGEIDLTLNTTLADVATLQTVDPSIGHAQTDQGWLYEHLDFNTERAEKGLGDPAVRRALRMALDKGALLDVLFPGAGLEPACSISPPNLWYAADVECAPYDPDAAAAALDELGWIFDPDAGTRVKDGTEMRFRMCTSSGNPLRLTTLGRIAQDLNAIGVATDIQTESIPVYFGSWEETTAETDCNIYRGTFDISLYTSQVTGDPYSDYYFNYHSSQPATEANPGGVAITRIADPELDQLLDAIGAQVDPEAVRAAAAAVVVKIDELANEIPLYYRPEPLGVSSHLGGFDQGNPSTATKLWDVENWYFVP